MTHDELLVYLEAEWDAKTRLRNRAGDLVFPVAGGAIFWTFFNSWALLGLPLALGLWVVKKHFERTSMQAFIAFETARLQDYG